MPAFSVESTIEGLGLEFFVADQVDPFVGFVLIQTATRVCSSMSIRGVVA